MGGGAIGSNYTYTQNFEYMFVFSKGKPKSVNLIRDVRNKTFGSKRIGGRKTEVKQEVGKEIVTNEYSKRNNWWLLVPQEQEGSEWHPAVFPEKIARDHIVSWSNEGDLVYDPFMGSGTTGKMAVRYNRNFIGSEISQEYADKATKRIENERSQLTLF